MQTDIELRSPNGSGRDAAKPAFEMRAGESNADFAARAAQHLATRAI